MEKRAPMPISTRMVDPVRCQARPAAARPSYRLDMLCASNANGAVRFGAARIPVCRMHEATFARWGRDADANARERWGWGLWSLEVVTLLAAAADLLTS
jgi:hypothetical protein